MAEPAETQTQASQEAGFEEPLGAFNFRLEIQGAESARFAECSGLGVKVHAIEYREGGINQVVHRLPGPVKYGDVTLRYGLTSSLDMWEWFLSAVEGHVSRRNVSIVVLRPNGVDEAARWNLVNAWPCEWRGAPLDALGQEIAVESVTLVFDTLERG